MIACIFEIQHQNNMYAEQTQDRVALVPRDHGGCSGHSTPLRRAPLQFWTAAAGLHADLGWDADDPATAPANRRSLRDYLEALPLQHSPPLTPNTDLDAVLRQLISNGLLGSCRLPASQQSCRV